MELSALIESRAREFEKDLSESGSAELARYLDGLEGTARSSLIARLVDAESKFRSDVFGAEPAPEEAPREDTRPRHERFRLIRELGVGGMGVVYEAWDREREMSVALKTMKRLKPELLMLLKTEFRSLAQIVHPNLVSLYELFSDGEQCFFSMEFIENAVHLREALRGDEGESESLTAALTEDASSPTTSAGVVPSVPHPAGDLDYDRVAELFSKVAEGVVTLHAEGKLHRDLKPGNVLVGSGDRVVVMDFGLVAELVRPRGSEPGDDRLEDSGVLARGGAVVGTLGYMAPEQAMAKTLGPASDWYAVGVMLFEVLTGHLPFEGKRSHIIRAKLTEQPPRASSLNPSVPAELDDLCLRLLDPEPARRPSGEEVLKALTKEAPRGAAVAPEPRRFIGREKELASLREALARGVDGETAIVFLSGRSGVGKSALVEEFLDEVSESARSLVLSGRCYEQETVPFKAFDSVVDELAAELARLPPEIVEDALPEETPALARIFPVLETVGPVAERGREPLHQDLEGLRRRGFSALRRLLSNLARHRTVVIHIDDLQWSDLDSADLLSELLLPGDRPPVLVLVSYRSEYVDRSPPLAAVTRLGAEPGSGVERSDIPVGGLSPGETRELAASILGDSGTDEQLDWIVEESEGIAFFVYELALFAREAGARPKESNADLERVLWDRIRRYPKPARRLLEVVAVAARPLSLRSAQGASEVGMLPPEMLASLRRGNLLRGSGAGLLDQLECYHDRVREIVAGQLGAGRLQSIHAALARTLEANEEGGPERLARHYYESNQTEAAGRYFEEAADGAARALAFDRAEEFYRRCVELAGSARERALRQEKTIHFYTDAARFDDAYRAGREALQPLGVSLPKRFQVPTFLIDLLRARVGLGRREIAELIDLPTSEDERHTLAIRLLAAVGKAAYQLRPELCIAVLVKSVNGCLARGNTPDAAVGFMAFGAIFLGGILGRHRQGHQFGRLSLDIVDKYQDDAHRAEVNFVVGYFGSSWLEPSQRAEELFDRAFEAGQASGDLFHTGCACAAGAMHRFMRGVPFSELREETDRSLDFLEQLRLRETQGCVLSVRQSIRNLCGETRSRVDLSDDDFDEASFERGLANYGSRHFAHYHFINRMIAMLHWHEIDAALEAAERSHEFLKDSKGMLHSAEHYFYRALILSAADRDGRPGAGAPSRELRRTARRYAAWARHCPENFGARAVLLEGELARRRDHLEEASNLLCQAATEATEFGQHPIAALAQRSAAVVLREHEDDARAAALERSAAESYRRWGSEVLARRWGPAAER